MNEFFTKSNSEFKHTTLDHATLEEALCNVVIPLKRGSAFAEAIEHSRFLNYCGEDGKLVIPPGDDLIEINQFSGGEFALTLLPEEIERNGRQTTPAYYTSLEGERKRFFSDVIGHNLDRKIVYIVATPSTDPFWQPDQILTRMQIATETAKNMGAKKVYAVFSEFPFARQDRGVNAYNRADNEGSTTADRIKHHGQIDIVGMVIRDFMVNGCDGIVTLHHHSGHIDDIVRSNALRLGRNPDEHYIFNLNPSPLFARYLQITNIFTDEEKANKGEGIVFIAPDEGAFDFAKTIKTMTGYENADLVYIEKKRARANDPAEITGRLIRPDGTEGNYKGKTGLIPDDIIDTFGTIGNAIKKLPSSLRRFMVYGTHGIFAKDAEDRMRRQDKISDVIILDTRYSRLRKLGPGTKRKVTIIKPGEFVAHTLARYVPFGINPNPVYERLFYMKPEIFDRLYRIKQFDQHYSKV